MRGRGERSASWLVAALAAALWAAPVAATTTVTATVCSNPPCVFVPPPSPPPTPAPTPSPPATAAEQIETLLPGIDSRHFVPSGISTTPVPVPVIGAEGIRIDERTVPAAAELTLMRIILAVVAIWVTLFGVVPLSSHRYLQIIVRLLAIVILVTVMLV